VAREVGQAPAAYATGLANPSVHGDVVVVVVAVVVVAVAELVVVKLVELVLPVVKVVTVVAPPPPLPPEEAPPPVGPVGPPPVGSLLVGDGTTYTVPHAVAARRAAPEARRKR
jgi:hypothetical protein